MGRSDSGWQRGRRFPRADEEDVKGEGRMGMAEVDAPQEGGKVGDEVFAVSF